MAFFCHNSKALVDRVTLVLQRLISTGISDNILIFILIVNNYNSKDIQIYLFLKISNIKID